MIKFETKLLIILLGIQLIQLNLANKTESNNEGYTYRKNCPFESDQQLLSVLPGIGWDNLINRERGPTFEREVYSLCRTSTDGHFLIPDDIIVEPIKNSEIKLSSEVYESISQCRSLTAYSINTAVQGSYGSFGINGDFSFEKESIREKLGESRGLIVQTEVRHNRYFIRQMPDSKFHPRFKNRLLDIVSYLEQGNVTIELIELFNNGQFGKSTSPTDSLDQEFKSMNEMMKAFYLADLLVRDFGTHSISSVYVGGLLAKTDTLDRSSFNLKQEERWKLASSATANFANLFNLKVGGSIEKNDSTIDNYSRKVTYSRITSYGGPILQVSNTNLSSWEMGLNENLVVIDRNGQPIYEIITPRSLPELSGHMILRLILTVKSAVDRYYKANTVTGCMNPASIFYDNEANQGSTDCGSFDRNQTDPKNNLLIFGGIYQTCTGPQELCLTNEIANPSTGSFTCPQNYLPIQLLPDQIRSCFNECVPNKWRTESKCTTKCAVTQAYWCSFDPSIYGQQIQINEDGFLFGGLYTDKEPNPVTKQFSCPEYYWPLMLGRRMRICMSTDRELGSHSALPFGGFYSCFSGNPLVNILNQNQTEQTQKQTIRSWLKQNYQQEHRAKTQLRNTDINLTNEYSNLLSFMWPKICPTGYTAHLAAMEDICQVNYCVRANFLQEKRKRHLKRPPFVLPYSLQPDLFKSTQTDLNLFDDQMLVHDLNGNKIERYQGEWLTNTNNNNNLNQTITIKQLKNLFIIILTILSFIIIILLTVIIIILIRKYKKFQRTNN